MCANLLLLNDGLLFHGRVSFPVTAFSHSGILNLSLHTPIPHNACGQFKSVALRSRTLNDRPTKGQTCTTLGERSWYYPFYR